MLIRNFQTTLKSRLKEKNLLIQIVIGPRQVGKTTAAQALYDQWEGPKLMITADAPSPPPAEWIRHHWEQARQKGDGTLFIIDEVQKIPSWSEQIKLLFDQDRNKRDLKIILLGSSSLFLQKGMTESLAGRFELIEAPHWSYAECKKAFNWNFETYLSFGAYPGAVPFIRDESRWRHYILNSIIEPILSKDILGVYPVDKPALFRQTFELAVQYPSKIISLQKMLGQLQDRGNAATIKHYLNLLEKTFLIKTLQKYSGSPIQIKQSSPKIVVLNSALIHAYRSPERLKQEPEWFGDVFESVLGAQLSRLPDSELFYWREGNLEVDYILKTPKELYALEIKSGMKKTKEKGLIAFSKKYPEAHCETWNFERGLQFLEEETL